MSSRTRQLIYDTRRSRDSSTFTGSYQTLGSAFAFPMTIVKIVNNSTVAVDISTDGSNDQDYIPANSFALYDLTGNSPSETGSIYVKYGTQFYVKGTAGTGSVYLVALYIPQL